MEAAAVTKQPFDHVRREDGLPRASGNHVSLLQDQHMGEPLDDLIHVVRHAHDAEIRMGSKQQGKGFEELLPGARIKPLARFIQEEQLGPGRSARGQ